MEQATKQGGVLPKKLFLARALRARGGCTTFLAQVARGPGGGGGGGLNFSGGAHVEI